MLFVFLTISFTALLIYLLLKKNLDKKNVFFEKIPSPPSYPIIGTALEFFVPPEKVYNLQFKLKEIYGERCGFSVFGRFALMLSNPSDVEKILTSSAHINKGTTYEFIRPWLGDGLLTSGGKKWQKRRKLLTPSFHFRILEDFLAVFNEQSKVLVDVFRDEFPNGQTKNICGYITRCTFDVIGETILGIKFNSQRNVNSEYLEVVTKACEIMSYRSQRPHCWPEFLFYSTALGREYRKILETLHGFTYQVIKERKALRADVQLHTEETADTDEIYWHGKQRLAFLDLLLDAQTKSENDLTDLDMREEVDTFMFEGHDTTSASLNWTIFLLGSNPQCQAKVHEELDKIFGEDRTRPITSRDLVEMKYLEMCIKEALRLFPSVPFFSRNLTSDLALDKDLIVPAGFDVMVFTMTVHRHPDYFLEPDKFIPERFLPENCANRHPFAYIPFSAGPRNCIGQKFALMEEKVILANIFRNFRVEAAEALEDIVVMLEVVTRPRDGLRVRLFPRVGTVL